jgi:hypothetical protein
MKPRLPLRIASILMFFHAVPHTIGTLTAKKVTDGQALKTLDMMSTVPVPMLRGPSSSTYFDFYFGYGLSSTVTLLTLCALFWVLAGQADEAPVRVRNLLIPLLAAMIGYAAVDFAFFFAVPAITCALTALCLAVSVALLYRK